MSETNEAGSTSDADAQRRLMLSIGKAIQDFFGGRDPDALDDDEWWMLAECLAVNLTMALAWQASPDEDEDVMEIAADLVEDALGKFRKIAPTLNGLLQ
jgi:hypothetical protein